MRFLIRIGHHIDLLDTAVLIEFTGRTELARPLVRQPRSTFFVGIGILVILALKAERLFAPGELKDLENLLKCLTVDTIGLASVTSSGANVDLLRHLVQPAGLIAASEADKRATFGQLVEPGNFQRQT